MIKQRGSGMAQWMDFSDPAGSRGSTLHGAGLRLGAIGSAVMRPVVVACNHAETESVLSARLPYSLEDGRSAVLVLPEVILAPAEVKDLTELFQEWLVGLDAGRWRPPVWSSPTRRRPEPC
jgi:hypothetical protein